MTLKEFKGYAMEYRHLRTIHDGGPMGSMYVLERELGNSMNAT